MKYNLVDWQLDFVNTYLKEQKPNSLLRAAPGTGKAITSLFLANKMIESGSSDRILSITDKSVLREQWRHVNNNFEIPPYPERFESITVQSLNDEKRHYYYEAAKENRYFVIADEFNFNAYALPSFIEKFHKLNSGTKALFLARNSKFGKNELKGRLRIDSDYIFQPSILKLKETKIELFRDSPSLSVFDKLLKRGVSFDDLSWREFEKLISKLLEKDGYEVELMEGTKDGGVDVIAYKDLGSAGFFKTIWQAKKKLIKNKVGLSVIRELADTTKEFKASKGFIVTNSYLTAGALSRVHRDQHTLGKVDRDDLNSWINRYFINR